jgi:hypothetical protein
MGSVGQHPGSSSYALTAGPQGEAFLPPAKTQARECALDTNLRGIERVCLSELITRLRGARYD